MGAGEASRRAAAALAAWTLWPAAPAGAVPREAEALLAEADALYVKRAEGASGALARPGPAEAAVAAYRSALAEDPDSALLRARLLRALFFRATFCGARPDERRVLLEEAKRLADAGLERLEARVGKTKGPDRLAALREVPQAVQLYFWGAVTWGEWALVRGTFAAARQGAAGRIRDLGQTVVDLDPDMEQGGGYRILGRLHDRSPRIPFFTLWISRDEAVEYLRKALAAGPTNTVNQLFLAEALLAHRPRERLEARRLLEACAGAEPRPEYLVEDAHWAALARGRLEAAGP